MLSFNQAQILIKAHAPRLKIKTVLTKDAHGYLAANIYAPIDLPPFTNSAVDGFALNTADFIAGQSIPIVQSLRATAQERYELKAGSCAYIMTGAPLPGNADCVIMKEHAQIFADSVFFDLTSIKAHSYVRTQGEDVRRGSLVAVAGSKLSPQLIGALLGLGIAEVPVFAPRIRIICTGDELIQAPQKLEYGQVYFLVGAMLKAQCLALGFNDVELCQIGDHQVKIEKAINNYLDADILLITGGMSRGDYDLVPKALKSCGAEQIFHYGAWRPGKPLYFGRLRQTIIFGLPGNPVACFVGFRVFVQSMLGEAINNEQLMSTKTAYLRQDFTKIKDISLFARAKLDDSYNLTCLPGQGSHEIVSLSQANALCLFEPDQTLVKAGELVKYYPI